MSKHVDTGRNPSDNKLREAERVLRLSPGQQKNHPAAVVADHSKLSHINTYGSLPDFYLDRPFTCRKCGKREIWKAQDQKWYSMRSFWRPFTTLRYLWARLTGSPRFGCRLCWLRTTSRSSSLPNIGEFDHELPLSQNA